MANKSYYTFQRISAPEATKESLKTFTRKVNEQLEALAMKTYGNVEFNDLHTNTKKLIIDSTLSAGKYVADLAEKAGIGKLTHIGDTPPATPEINKVWLDVSVVPNVFRRWTGTIWVDAGGSQELQDLTQLVSYKATIFYQTTAPESPTDGDMWYDTDASPVVIWRRVSGAWVNVTTASLSAALEAANTAQATADGKVRTFAQTTEPGDMASTDVGDLWIDTANFNKLYRYSGTAWEPFQDVHNDGTLNTLMAEIPLSSLANGDLRTLLESVSHSIEGILLNGLGSKLQLLLGPAQITFKENGQAVMWISGQNTTLTSLTVRDKLEIGVGGPTYVPTATGYVRK